MRGQCMVMYLCLKGLVIAVSVVFSTTYSTPVNGTLDPVKNFSCITYDYEIYIICTWDLEPSTTSDNLNISIYYVWEIHDGLQCTNRTNTSCKLDMRDLDIDPDLGHLKICIVRCYTIQYTRQVKPSPVFNIEASTNSSCIKIKWMHSRSVESWGEQIYRVQVTSLWTKSKKFTTDTTGKEVRFCSLIPNTQYSVSVSAKPNDSGLWSEAVLISVTTLPSLPYSPPKTCMNCFRLVKDGSLTEEQSFRIHIYWKNLQQEYWNDNTMMYRLEWKSSCTTKSHIAKRHVIRSSPYKIEIPIACHPLQVSLWSVNSHGMSPVPSEIKIPEPSKLLSAPKAFGYINRGKSQLNVTWETDEWNDQTNLTLFWCRRGILMSCTSDVNWLEVTGRAWAALRINPASQYMFAVAKEQNGAVTGIHWTDCIMHDSGIPFSPEAEINNNNKEVHIRWHFPRCSDINLQRHISQFHVSFCFSRTCNDKTTVSVDSSTMEISFPFEQNHTEACASVQAVFHEPGPESHWICTHRYRLHAGHVHFSRWMLIAGVTTFAFLGIILCICLYRRYIRKSLEIQVPAVYRIDSSTTGRVLETSAASAENEKCPMLRTEKRFVNISTNPILKTKNYISSENMKDLTSITSLKGSKNTNSTCVSTIDEANEREYIALGET